MAPKEEVPMRIITRAVLDIETNQWLTVESYEYNGAIALCKGDSVAKEEEQQTATFDQSLMQIFQSQYATQSSQLNFLSSQLEPAISEGGQGYTPQQLASMRTSATDTNSQEYQAAQQALQNQTSQASGGSKLTGVAGANVEADAALANQEAIQQSSSQNQITQANANLQQTNYWNSVNALNGVAAQENPLGYAGASSNAGGTVAGLGNTVTNANQSQLLGALGGIVGGVATGAGTAIGGPGGAGSIGALFCWVAASFWGWNDFRTCTVRGWIGASAPAWFRNFYIKYGERIAATPLRWLLRPLFEIILYMESH